MLWDAVRTKVDERGLPGQFILTGSNAIDNSKIHHSGTGRIQPLAIAASHTIATDTDWKQTLCFILTMDAML